MNLKKYSIIIAALAAAASHSCSRQNEALQWQIDELSSGRIATLEEQHDSVAVTLASLGRCDDALKRYVDAIEGCLEEMRSTTASDAAALPDIAEASVILKDAQDSLRMCITEIKEYMDAGILTFREWSEGTLATLVKHAEVCGTLAQINASVNRNAAAITSLHDDMVIECRALVKEEIKETEKSLKAWVNEKFTGYLTAAQMQVKLDSLAKVSDADIVVLLSEVSKVRDEITSAYTVVIKEAIEKYDGELTAKLAEKVNDFTISAEAKLSALEERLSAVENTAASLLSSIQSIACVPAYNDGFAALDVAKSETVLKYKIMPLSAAEKLVALWKSVSDSTGVTDTIFRVRSRETVTQSGSHAVTVTYLPVKKVSYGSGIVSVTVNHEVMSDAYWTGDVGAGASLVINGGLDIKTSAYMPLRFTPTLEVAPANTFLQITARVPIAVNVQPSVLKEKIVWTTSDKQKATVVKGDTSRCVLGMERKGGVTVTATLTLLGKTYAKSFSMSVIPYNAVPGYFSISATKKVTFAHGNLQYVGKTRRFNFASQQYIALWDNAGNTNSDWSARVTQSSPIDLLGWATGLTNYYVEGDGLPPSSCNIYNSNYNTGTAAKGEKLTYSNHGDWGFDIDGGTYSTYGDKKGYPYWRTLSVDEWLHLIGSRDKALQKRGFGTVKYESYAVHGLIILPDTFADPMVNTSSKASDKMFVPSVTTGWDANIYTASGWSLMEKAGAVFLPAAGARSLLPLSINKINDEGWYWTSTGNSSVNDHAYRFCFSEDDEAGELFTWTTYRREGLSIRLVADQDDGQPQ